MSKIYTFLDLEKVNRPFMPEIKAALESVALSGRYIGGAEVDRFERQLAEATGTAHAVGVANGLDALRLIFRSLVLLGRLSPGDEVLIPANTYIASFLAVSDAGLRPVPVDIDADTSNMSAGSVARAITPRVRAVMPVHLYGRVCWNRELSEIVARHNLVVVEDNAQAIGAVGHEPGLWGNVRSGAIGHAAAFSFYPTKNIGAMGDAGAVTTGDTELAAAVRTLANYGSDRRYHNIYRGCNSRMDPVQAAVLNVKLPHADAVNGGRRRTASIYLEEIKNPLVSLPAPAGTDCVWHQFVVRTPQRDRFKDWLENRGVYTDINYPVPCHRQPCYRGELDGYILPVAEEQARTLLCLPIACVGDDDAREIAAIINSYKEND
ncbi:MAG: DegT/DnrJ/EryC1/StrS family aminotransferase [Muribaculaceae bacterium]|nr:DegT/DnrJ/EryC1/StrS family aminotransferase [Muribaculaceae bacterium]